MIGITVNIKDAIRGLDKLGGDFLKAISISIEKSALLIWGQSKKNAPVDTGNMRGGIFTSILPMTASIVSPVSYSIYVHEGTRYMRARPFLYDAAEQKREEILDTFDRELNKAVDSFNK